MSTFNWPRELTLKLINLYREQPILYNPHNPDYKNAAKRLTAIMEIHEQLKVVYPDYKTDANEIRKKIHGIRTQYLKETKMRAQTKKYRRTLWCFDQLRFLDNLDNNDKEGTYTQVPLPIEDCKIKEESTGNAFFYFSDDEENHSIEVDNEMSNLTQDCKIKEESTSLPIFNFTNDEEENDNKTEDEVFPNIDKESNPSNSIITTNNEEKETNFRSHFSHNTRNSNNNSFNNNKSRIVTYNATTSTSSDLSDKSQEERDDIDYFLRLLGIEFRKIRSKNKKRKLKKQLYNLVLDTQEEDENSS